MLYQAIEELIGTVPVGFEPLVYVMCVPILLFILVESFSILWSVINWLGGK